MSDYATIAVEAIAVPAGRRPLRDVTRLADSINDLGLLHPITVTETYRLIAGYHRLEACRSLDWSVIDALVLSVDEVQARRIEIGENLCRTDLSNLERCQLEREDKHLYVAAHPETKQGGDHGNQHTGGKPRQTLDSSVCLEAPKAYTKVKATQEKRAESTIRREIQIADHITAAVAEQIATLPVAWNAGGLLEIARMPEDQQAEVAEVLTSGKAETVKEAKEIIRHRTRRSSRRARVAADYAAREEVVAEIPTDTRYQLLCGDLLIAGAELAVAHWWNRALRAGLHPGLVTLACSLKEEPYLIRLVGDQVERLGPLSRAVCIDQDDKERPCFTVSGFAWEPATDALLDDLNPYGAWYVAQEKPDGTRYTKHTQGYQDALSAFLRSPEAKAFINQPWQFGRVPCLLLFPSGSFATGPDATAQPIVLPLHETNDAKSLRGHLDDLILERTWPGSL